MKSPCAAGAVLAVVIVAAACGPTTTARPEMPAHTVAIDGADLPIDLAQIEHPTLLVFWASWCAPCRAEAPELLELGRRLDGRLDLIGVSVDEERGDAVAFAERLHLDYPSIHDPTLAVADALGVEGVPMLVLLAPGGVEVARSAKLSELSGEIARQVGPPSHP